MRLDPFTSLATLFVLLLLIGGSVWLVWYLRHGRRSAAEKARLANEELQRLLPDRVGPYEASAYAINHKLDGREAAARHMYGQAVGWKRQAMEDYDHNEIVQATWLAEADRAIARSRRWPQDQTLF